MKRLLSWMLAIAIMVSVIPLIPVPASAESLYIRKIVSVVYDDSGSMSGSKSAYANYAMQAFCGMLNSEDQLFITYMRDVYNNPKANPEKIDLSAGNIQGSVDSIRNHSVGGGTPYAAVETAYRKLQNVSDSNPNTQYWLVVITDGDFDVYNGKSDNVKIAYLNEKFNTYTAGTMPNGTHPQVTFLGIGDVAKPDENPSKGIYTYAADNAAGIIGAMSDMADRISGRTRLQKSDIKQIDDKTIQVSSSIPLLNIAAFVQGSQAKLTGASNGEGANIPISRKVSLHYSGHSSLVGGAYLIGDSQTVIGSGTYTITFDQKVNLDNLIVLFEPALEMRMTLTLNGKKVTDNSELSNSMEGDKISVSCKIYEMGTDKEIDPSLLPPGTKYAITVSEGGKTTQQSTGKDMQLQDYVLKNTDTEITGAVMIEGFNPIDFSVKFTPTKYVPKIVYTVVPSFGSGVKSVKFDDIANNKDLTVCFTVLADGVAMTDPEAVKALKPTISLSPQGNDGTVTYSKDGKIVFTPNTASTTTSNDGSFGVTVTCTLEDGTSASETYTVLLATYEVVAINATNPVKKTALFGNQTSVSFYITKDGVKLDKAAVEQQISLSLNEAHSELKMNVSVAPDGTITVTPYSEEQHTLTFWNWWINWAYYWGLPGDDITVTLNHAFGSGAATIDIVEEDGSYQFLNVYLPFIIEIAIAAYLFWWGYAIYAKPKFLPGAVIYMADVSFGGKPGNRYHEIDPITEVNLKQYNKLKHRWKPTLNSKKHEIGKNLTISAGYGGSIVCHSEVWYKGDITPKNRVQDDLSHPQYVKTYIEDHDSLKIDVISPYDADAVHLEESIDNPNSELYYLHTKMANISTVDGIQVIDNGTIFAYAIRLDQ